MQARNDPSYLSFQALYCKHISLSRERFVVPKILTFLHTSPVHIATFNGLLAEIDAPIPVKHIVDESLLHDARTHGITPDLQQRINKIILDAMTDDTGVLVCTCSTIV